MRRAFRFVIGLVLGLASLTWITSILVQRTTRRWVANDANLRAQLVVGAARQTLTSHWRKDQSEELQSTLAEIARNERIMAAAACNGDLSLLASTTTFPSKFSCMEIGNQVSPRADATL